MAEPEQSPRPWEDDRWTPELQQALDDLTRTKTDMKALQEAHDRMEQAEDFRDMVTGLFQRRVADEAARILHSQWSNPVTPMVALTDADLDARPAPEWWIEGLLQKDSDAMLAGPPGLGKSFLAFHLTRCMAFGMDAFGQKVTKGAKTLYVVAEGVGAFPLRKNAWEARWRASVPISAGAPGYVHYVDAPVNLSVEASVDELRRVFQEGDFDILVIDTWSQLSGVADENQAAEAARVINAVKSIRRVKPGSASIIVHHTDARGTKARGSTVLTANVDTVIILKPDGEGFSITTKRDHGGKQKDAKPLTLNGFTLVDAPNGLPSAVIEWTGRTPVSPRWEPVRDALADGEWHSTTELRTALSITDSRSPEADRLKADLRTWHASGLLERDDSNRSLNKYRMLPIPGLSEQTAA